MYRKRDITTKKTRVGGASSALRVRASSDGRGATLENRCHVCLLRRDEDERNINMERDFCCLTHTEDLRSFISNSERWEQHTTSSDTLKQPQDSRDED